RLRPAPPPFPTRRSSDLGAAAQHARCMLNDGTVVLTIQNGLGSAQYVAAAVGEGRLAVGIAAAFGASLPEAGHAHHNSMAAVRIDRKSTRLNSSNVNISS